MIDGSLVDKSKQNSSHAWNFSERNEVMIRRGSSVINRLPLSLIIFSVMFFVCSPSSLFALEPGVSAADLTRDLGLLVVLLSVVILILAEFVFHRRIPRDTYHWLILIGLFVFPLIAVIATTTTVFEETKKVASCAACHVMDPFVDNMRDAESSTLAAMHFKNKWIPENQCFACHTTYGIHGTFEAKRDGFRHWLLYVTDTYEEPITFKGSFPNVSCLECHQGTEKYEEVLSHQALSRELIEDRVGCYTCHGPAHPTPDERHQIARDPLWERQKEIVDASTR